MEVWERNQAFEEAGGYNPWEKLGISQSYCSLFDEQAISVLKGIRAGEVNTSIAAKNGMSPEHAELLQYIFCGAGWCSYGGSPRGCFPDDREEFDKIIANWEAYAVAQWSDD